MAERDEHGRLKKGHGGLKPKGAESKVKRDIKEAYKNLLEMNLDNMTKWLEDVAEKNPAEALKIMMGLSEYILPKLARTELKHDGELGVIVQPFVISPPEKE